MISEQERWRYARQLMLPDLGLAAQDKLRAACVLVVGAGGLGSPALTYLAAAGVGRLGIVDFDVVEESNLHRQPLHATADLGRFKTVSAAEKLRALNPYIEVVEHRERLVANNAFELSRRWAEQRARMIDAHDPARSHEESSLYESCPSGHTAWDGK